jgi:hypothetical protein
MPLQLSYVVVLQLVLCAVVSSGKDLFLCTKSLVSNSKPEATKILQALLMPLSHDKFWSEIVQQQPAVLAKKGSIYFHHLLGFEDIDEMLLSGRKSVNPSLRIEHGVDWRVAKRVFADGKWHTGVLPATDNMTLALAKEAFARGGFSIIIDSVESLSPRVNAVAVLLEEALGWRVRTNL